MKVLDYLDRFYVLDYIKSILIKYLNSRLDCIINYYSELTYFTKNDSIFFKNFFPEI